VALKLMAVEVNEGNGELHFSYNNFNSHLDALDGSSPTISLEISGFLRFFFSITIMFKFQQEWITMRRCVIQGLIGIQAVCKSHHTFFLSTYLPKFPDFFNGQDMVTLWISLRI